ncbi:hypothetical protein SAMN05421690_10104 [Nitrosomonas sp. Nm51]|uniref:hypothetical protein n=1 Tax=Nitrosomonas sp. Nm51 TaxID=133720 RepID=UPI0008C15ADC|nr:hypothetical protein [Nitrosomonas sp. Nm51]SER14780.1 hypothetical protein SAMN05421690_10104 [Nitrosomonas sp. Nm51]
MASFNAVRADMFCIIKVQRAECSPLPVITHAKFSLTDSHFSLSAQYASCFSERTLEIQGRVLRTVNTGNVQEFELLGESYDPVTDFIAFPRTIAYLVLDKSTEKGMFTDVWSAQQLMRHPVSSVLTVPVNCKNNQRRQH